MSLMMSWRLAMDDLVVNSRSVNMGVGGEGTENIY